MTDIAADDEFRMLAENFGESADAIFAAHCRSQQAARGKTVWGEKTPRHVFRSKDILGAFPTAKLLVMIRDPRGVVASYRDWNDRLFNREDRRVSFGIDRPGSCSPANVVQSDRHSPIVAFSRQHRFEVKPRSRCEQGLRV